MTPLHGKYLPGKHLDRRGSVKAELRDENVCFSVDADVSTLPAH